MFATLKKAMGGSAKAAAKLYNLDVDPSDLDLRVTFHHGCPSTISAIAVDHYQKLIAVGGADGNIKLYGSLWVEVSLMGPEMSFPITLLRFVTNKPRLLGVGGENKAVLHVWNLSRNSCPIVSSQVLFPAEITEIHVPYDSNWLWIGTRNVSVHVFDVNRNNISLYTIPRSTLIEEGLHNPPPGTTVSPSETNLTIEQMYIVALRISPTDPNTLLIALPHTLLLWSVERKAVTHRMECGASITAAPITAAVWQREGKIFASGHAGAAVILWRLKKGGATPEVLYAYDPSATPITRLVWTSPKVGPSFLYAGGGDTGTWRGITVFANPDKTNRQRTLVPVFDGVTDMAFDFVNPWEADACAPRGVTVLTKLGTLEFYNTNEECRLQGTAEPPPQRFAYQSSPITALHVAERVPLTFMTQLYRVGVDELGLSENEWRFSGGSIGLVPDHGDSSGVLTITGHHDGVVRFFDMASLAVFLVYTIDLKTLTVPGPESHAIVSVRFDVESLTLVVHCEDGTGYVFRFSGSAEASPPKVIVDSGDGGEAALRAVTMSLPGYQQAGFQLRLLLGTSVSPSRAVALAGSYRRLAVLTTDGTLSLFDLRRGSLLVHKVLNSATDDAVALSIQESLTEVNDGALTVTDPVLIVGYRSGLVEVHSLATFECTPLQPNFQSAVVASMIVDDRGLPYPLPVGGGEGDGEEEEGGGGAPSEEGSGSAVTPPPSSGLRRASTPVASSPKLSESGRRASTPREESSSGTSFATAINNVPLTIDGEPEPPSASTPASPSSNFFPGSNTARVERGRRDVKGEPPRFLLVVSTRRIRLYALPFVAGEKSSIAKVVLEDNDPAIVRASIVKHESGDGAVLAVLDTSSTLKWYSLLHLKPISSEALVLGSTVGIDQLLLSAWLGNGQMLVPSREGNLMWISSWTVENTLNLPYSLPSIYDESVTVPPKPSVSLFTSLFGAQPVDTEAVLSEHVNEEAPRRAGDRKQKQAAVADEAGTSEVKNIMAQNRQKLEERGERIAIVQDKSEALANDSANFLATIQKYNEEQAKKSWWQL